MLPPFLVKWWGQGKNMKDVLKEYSDAVSENIEASKLECEAKDRKKKAHYRLLRASEELRMKTRELLEDTYILN